MTAAATSSLRFLFTKIPSIALHCNVFGKPASSLTILIENLNSSASFLHHKRLVTTTAGPLSIQLKENIELKTKTMSSKYEIIEKGAPNSTNYSIYFSK